mgnify:FL=1
MRAATLLNARCREVLEWVRSLPKRRGAVNHRRVGISKPILEWVLGCRSVLTPALYLGYPSASAQVVSLDYRARRQFLLVSIR